MSEPDTRPDEDDAEQTTGGRDLLPDADADQTDAEKYSTDEGRTEEDREP